MNTKGITGGSQVGPLITEKPDMKSGLIAPNDKQSAERSSGTGVQGYDVNLSKEAREMVDARTKAFDIARNTSDVREDRVAALRKKIQAGQYKVDAGKIADGMLKEAVKDELAMQIHNDAKFR